MIHAGQPIERVGPAQAPVTLILLHGRGGSAVDMIDFAANVVGPAVACVAPQAALYTWWPGRFMDPIGMNEAFLDSALALVDSLVAAASPSRVALLGFSQGACLALEYLYRRETPLGAVIGLSGGLFGETISAPGPATLARTPVLLDCSERDPHIPRNRVVETEAALRARGAAVAMHIYPGDSHTITSDEVRRARELLATL